MYVCMHICIYHLSTYSGVLLFVVDVFYKSSLNTELVNTESLLLEEIQDYTPLNLWSQPVLIK